VNTTSEKEHVHVLVERLAPNQVTAIRGLLEAMLDPVGRAIATAPPDDEPATDEDRLRLRQGRVWFEQHDSRGVPMKDVLAEFNLKPDDFPDASDRSR
jgi:hypothetical protein